MISGHKKIDWAKRFMPLLNLIESEYSQQKPLKDFTVGMSIHLEAKTACLAITLGNLGAKVVITGSNPLSTQDDVAEALKEHEIMVFAKHTKDEDVYFRGIVSVLEQNPDLILDDGADLTITAHTKIPSALKNLKGITEETTTGVRRIKALKSQGKLKIPVIAVNEALMKHLFDNRYGTGQSTWDSVMRNTNLLVSGKTVVVAGYGWCGRGIAFRARGLGARVIVTEIDPIKAIEAIMDGFEVMRMKEAAEHGDFFICATGNTSVISVEEFLRMKNGAVLSNAGHFNVEVDVKALERLATQKFEARENVTGYILPNGKTIFLLAEGRLVNLAAADGHPVEIMDLSFAVQTLSLIYLSQTSLQPEVYPVPAEIDYRVAEMKLKTLGVKIDELSIEQRRYLESF